MAPTTKSHSGKGAKASKFKKSKPKAAFRKVTKKGAYKKKQKKNFMNKRAAVVETKRKTYEDLRAANYFVGTGNVFTALRDRFPFHVEDTEINHINPTSYYWWSQGLSQTQHIGQSVTVKHLNQKIQVRFPQPHMQVDMGGTLTPQKIPFLPQKYTLYWGWVPAPRMLTGNTTPASNVETIASLDSHVNNRVKDYFNERKDKLRFIPKRDSTIQIIGKKRINPDLRYQSTAPAVSEANDTKTAHGTIPDWYGEISWKMPNGGKKLWLEQSGNLTGAADLIGMYPNYSWLPFSIIVNWNHSETKTQFPTTTLLYMPGVSCNDIVYFTDS